MKLKPIIASLMLLGLAAPAFADAPAATASTQAQLDAMKAQLNKMEAVINQNNNGGFQQVADWTSRITVSGLMNVDGYMSNTTPNFDTETPGNGGQTNNIAVNNANLFVDALVNDWTNVHIGLKYDANRSDNFSREPNGPTFDEGYVTIGNFAESPFYFRGGREYVPFGQYDRYPLLQNPTQLLSETQATAAQVGFVSPVGVYGSAYAFRGMPSGSVSVNSNGNITGPATTDSRDRVQNYGFDLGYAYSDADMGFKFDAGYIRNMADVNYISQGIENANSTLNGLVPNGYINKVGGLALSLDANVANLDGALRYVGATQAFAIGNAATVNLSNGTVEGAKPYAYGAEVGLSFPVVAHQSRFAVGYQHSNDAAGNSAATLTGDAVNSNVGVLAIGGYGLPQNRYYGNYTVNISKWTDVGVGAYYDKDYSVQNGGTGKTATTGVIQLGVKFA